MEETKIINLYLTQKLSLKNKSLLESSKPWEEIYQII